MPKVEVVIPPDLLREVDDAAQQIRTDRNAFICRSLRSLLRTVRLHELRQQMLADARTLGEAPRDGVKPEGGSPRMGTGRRGAPARRSR